MSSAQQQAELGFGGAAQSLQTFVIPFTTTGTNTFIIPTGVTTLTVEAIGAGGGAAGGGNAGGGGAYANQ